MFRSFLIMIWVISRTDTALGSNLQTATLIFFPASIFRLYLFFITATPVNRFSTSTKSQIVREPLILQCWEQVIPEKLCSKIQTVCPCHIEALGWSYRTNLLAILLPLLNPSHIDSSGKHIFRSVRLNEVLCKYNFSGWFENTTDSSWKIRCKAGKQSNTWTSNFIIANPVFLSANYRMWLMFPLIC